jgi:small GTP-binding protein
MTHIKCVIVGEPSTGKSCMLISYVENRFPDDYLPATPQKYNKEVRVNDKPVDVSLWEAHSDEKYDDLRPAYYTDADIVLTCYSIISEDHFNKVSERWVPELKEVIPDVPYLLVGTKSDLRDDDNVDVPLISPEKGEKLAIRTNAEGYTECSAQTQDGLREVFDEAFRIVMKKRRKSALSPGKEKQSKKLRLGK